MERAGRRPGEGGNEFGVSSRIEVQHRLRIDRIGHEFAVLLPLIGRLQPRIPVPADVWRVEVRGPCVSREPQREVEDIGAGEASKEVLLPVAENDASCETDVLGCSGFVSPEERDRDTCARRPRSDGRAARLQLRTSAQNAARTCVASSASASSARRASIRSPATGSRQPVSYLLRVTAWPEVIRSVEHHNRAPSLRGPAGSCQRFGAISRCAPRRSLCGRCAHLV